MHAGNHSLHPLGGRGGSEEGPSITLVAASNAPTCTLPTSIRIRPHKCTGDHGRILGIFLEKRVTQLTKIVAFSDMLHLQALTP